MKNSTIQDSKIFNFGKISATNGNISVVSSKTDLPFDVKRIFYLYDIPAKQSRGAHAHIKCHQIVIAISGSFILKIDDGTNKMDYFLNQPDEGVYIPPGIWGNELNFSAGSVALVLASDLFEEDDYIRNYKDFLSYKN